MQINQNIAHVLDDLKRGNANYSAGTFDPSVFMADRRRTTFDLGQRPKVAVVGCSDSRAPIEIVLGQGIGDVFVVRLAGNRCSSTAMASLEFAVEILNTPLLVVLGHTKCGALEAALDEKVNFHSPHIDQLIERLRPTMRDLHRESNGTSKEALLNKAAWVNADESAQEIVRDSDLLRQKVLSGKLVVTHAVLDIYTGIVEWANS